MKLPFFNINNLNKDNCITHITGNRKTKKKELISKLIEKSNKENVFGDEYIYEKINTLSLLNKNYLYENSLIIQYSLLKINDDDVIGGNNNIFSQQYTSLSESLKEKLDYMFFFSYSKRIYELFFSFLITREIFNEITLENCLVLDIKEDKIYVYDELECLRQERIYNRCKFIYCTKKIIIPDIVQSFVTEYL
jgi:hypothetical protein